MDPYKAFRCDVPNLSTSLYFVINDQFRSSLQPKENLPEGITVARSRNTPRNTPDFVAQYYARLASTSDDAVTALNTMLAQDGLLIRVGEERARGTHGAGHQHTALRCAADDKPSRAYRDGRGCRSQVPSSATMLPTTVSFTTQVIEAYVADNASARPLLHGGDALQKHPRLECLCAAAARLAVQPQCHNASQRRDTQPPLMCSSRARVPSAGATAASSPTRTSMWTTTRSSTISEPLHKSREVQVCAQRCRRAGAFRRLCPRASRAQTPSPKR